MSTIANLKKAYTAQAITKDTFTLEKFHAKKEENDVARMIVVGIETKYIPHFHKEGGSQGYRTRFILENGETVGTFSNGAYRFFQFFAGLMGYQDIGNFVHIDIDGQVVVDVSIVALDATRSTYNFDLIEEGSELRGMSDYVPNISNVLQLNDGSFANKTTGEVTDTPDAELNTTRTAPEQESPKDPKKK